MREQTQRREVESTTRTQPNTDRSFQIRDGQDWFEVSIHVAITYLVELPNVVEVRLV